MEQNNKTEKTILIKNCECVTMNGVDHIVGFDEKCVVLSCDFGRVVIEGEGMKIESLTKNSGEICVLGKFRGMYFSEEKHSEGVFKKMLKW